MGKFRSLFQSGLPENRSASHHTVPAAIASRSVGEMAGRTLRYQERMGLVMWRARQLGEVPEPPYRFWEILRAKERGDTDQERAQILAKELQSGK